MNAIRKRSDSFPLISNSEYEGMVLNILNSGCTDPVLDLLEGYDPPFRPAQMNWIARTLQDELREFNSDCPDRLVKDIVIMRGLMAPTTNDTLALTLTRAWLYMAHVDDTCLRTVAGTMELLRIFMGSPTTSPLGRYTAQAFDELGRFSDGDFLAIYKFFYAHSIFGTLLEQEYVRDGDYAIDPQYVRDRTGHGEVFFSWLHFFDPSFNFWENKRFWILGMRPMVDLLDDGNDVFSFYKEAIHGADFAASTPYRRARREGIPYIAAYRRSVDNTLRAYSTILELGSDTQKPHLENAMKGYFYWKTCSGRYRWNELYPGSLLVDIPLQ
jgi:hypothetical protein